MSAPAAASSSGKGSAGPLGLSWGWWAVTAVGVGAAALTARYLWKRGAPGAGDDSAKYVVEVMREGDAAAFRDACSAFWYADDLKQHYQIAMCNRVVTATQAAAPAAAPAAPAAAGKQGAVLVLVRCDGAVVASAVRAARPVVGDVFVSYVAPAHRTAALQALVAHLQSAAFLAAHTPVSGAMGERESTRAFADAWCAAASAAALSAADGKAGATGARVVMDQNGYWCERVQWAALPPMDADVHFVVATAEHVPGVLSRRLAFEDELKLSRDADPLRTTQQMVADGKVYLLMRGGTGADAEVVCQSVCSGETKECKRIGGVYTPPQHRLRGHASQLVARIAQSYLDAGKRYAFLLADSANATSNGVYQKIGFKRCGDFLWLQWK